MTRMPLGDYDIFNKWSVLRAHINVRRANKRRGGIWVSDTLNSARSVRVVPLPPFG